MRGRRIIVLGLGTVAALVMASSVSAAAPKRPTGAQIRAAVHRAAHSRTLWATVNICDTAKYPHVLGIRGEMPALGFAAQARMTFMVDYAAGHAFKPLQGVAAPVNLGTVTSGAYQGGVRFTFAPHAGVLRGRVRFVWRIRGRTVATLVRATTAGHHGAGYGSPRGFSAAKCSIA